MQRSSGPVQGVRAQPRPWRFDVLTGCVTHARESRCVAHYGTPNFPFPPTRVLPRARHATSKQDQSQSKRLGTRLVAYIYLHFAFAAVKLYMVRSETDV